VSEGDIVHTSLLAKRLLSNCYAVCAGHRLSKGSSIRVFCRLIADSKAPARLERTGIALQRAQEPSANPIQGAGPYRDRLPPR